MRLSAQLVICVAIDFMVRVSLELVSNVRGHAGTILNANAGSDQEYLSPVLIRVDSSVLRAAANNAGWSGHHEDS